MQSQSTLKLMTARTIYGNQINQISQSIQIPPNSKIIKKNIKLTKT